MGAITGARTLDCRWNPYTPTCLNEGANIFNPCALVEVHREEPAGLIREERIDAHYMAAREVTDDRVGVERDECLIRAVAALDLGQFAHTPDEFVSAGWGVSAFPSLSTLESSWKDFLTPAKQRAKQPHLVGWCPGNRCFEGKGHTDVDFCFGVERGQLCSKGCEATHRLSLIGL
jgi:hypothetical protein